jgi:hypothetical protein
MRSFRDLLWIVLCGASLTACKAVPICVDGVVCSSVGNGSGSEFYTQEYNGSGLSEAAINSDPGDRISITQHTGEANVTVTGGTVAELEDLLIDLALAGSAEDVANAVAGFEVGDGELVLAATADGSDQNPAYLEQGDPPSINIASLGTATFAGGEDLGGTALLAFEQLDGEDLDAAVFALATVPNETEGVGEGFDYMSLTGWLTIDSDNISTSEVQIDMKVDFGVGHLGLATPIDQMPTGEVMAYYEGPFAGFLMDSGIAADLDDEGAIGVVWGNAMLEADFNAATVGGLVSEIGIEGVTLDGDPISDSIADISVDSLINGNTYAGTATMADASSFFEAGSSGPVDGVFYGPVDTIDGSTGPLETGAVLTVHDAAVGSDTFLTGVIGAQLTEAPSP